MVNKKTILIADDDRDLVGSLALRCRQLGLNVLTAYSGLEAAKMADDHLPDLLCLDMNMPCGNGLSVCEMLTTHESLSSSPTIIMTGSFDEETIRRCHNLCAYYVEKCPHVWQRLEPLIERLLCSPTKTDEIISEQPDSCDLPTIDQTGLQASNRKLIDVVFAMLGADAEYLEQSDPDTRMNDSRETPHDSRPWLLCIDDDAEYSMALKLRLQAHGIGVERAFEGMAGFRQAFMRPADAILLDYEMPNGQGDYVLGRLKDNPVTKDIPVIVITGHKDRALERQMINLGAARFLTKPVEFDVLLAELEIHIPDLQPV